MLLQQGRQGRLCCFRFQLGSLDILASSFPPTSPGFAELEISGGDITGVLIKPGRHTLKGHQHRLNGAPLPSQENTEESQSALQRNERANTALKVLSLVNCSKRAPKLIIQMPQ